MVSNKISPIRKKIVTAFLFVLIIAAILVASAIHRNGKKSNSDNANNQKGQALAEIPASNAEDYNNTLIAENDNYELYLSGPTLSVSMKDKKTGEILETTVAEDDGKSNKQWKGFMKSGVVLNVIDGLNDAVQADLINSKTEIAIAKIDSGFHAYVSFPDLGFTFQMSVTLEEDSLVVKIPDESITETMDKYHIGAINVFPFMGYSYLGEKEGYMFIPDGNGALIYLNDKEGRLTGGYSQMIYGDDIGFKDSITASLLWDHFQTVNDAENIMAPIFGMVHTADKIGFLGIIESGAQRASIEAYPNGVTLDYNRIYAKFLIRKVYMEPTSNSNTGMIEQIEEDRTHSDIQVRYCFVGGDAANYSGLAVKYRDYLINEGGIPTKDYSYHTRVDFLGSEREDWLIFKKKVTMTTVDNIREIFSDLNGEGITDIMSIYKGWQSGGLNAVPITKYKADGSIGGTSDLTALIKEAKKSGNQLYLYQDALKINPDEYNTTFNVVKRVDKRLFEEPTYKTVYEDFLYLIPKRSNYYIDKTIKDYSKNKITDIALAGITNHIYSYSYSGKYYSRTDTMNDYVDITSKMDEDYNLLLEQPFSYLWKYTDAFLDMPVGSSNYNFIDEDIPFLSIALKGVIPMYSEYMNFEANKQEFYLNLIEMGIYPSFYITYEDSSKLIYTNSADIYSSKYSIYKNDIIEYSKTMKEVNDAVQDAFIIGHQRLDSGVTVVSYDNGINVYINYSEEDKVVDGYTVEAMSYKVGEAK